MVSLGNDGFDFASDQGCRSVHHLIGFLPSQTDHCILLGLDYGAFCRLWFFVLTSLRKDLCLCQIFSRYCI